MVNIFYSKFSVKKDGYNDEEFLTLISDFFPNENDSIEKSLNPIGSKIDRSRQSNFTNWSNDDLISLTETSDHNDLTDFASNKSMQHVSEKSEIFPKRIQHIQNKDKFSDTSQFSFTKITTLLDNTNRDKEDSSKLTARNETAKYKDQNQSKIKFKNLFEFKKDVIIRKLLKTIDLMNQEIS